jgi:hypothetical protein
MRIGVDTDIGGDAKAGLDNGSGIQIRVVE